MKYIVFGGSSGIGLAISIMLKEQGNEIIIYDIKEPLYKPEVFIYKYVDLSKNDLSFAKEDIISSDGLIYTAGIGRLDKFYNYNEKDIESTILIDLMSFIKIITMSSNKLRSCCNFDCLVISSIAGLVSSPLFSLYSAAKAGICKYVEAVNTELEEEGFANRITNIIATSFKGTGFNGGETNLNVLSSLASELILSMKNKEELHMVNEDLINSIISRYRENSKKFSKESYKYKFNSGRLK